MIKQHSYQRSSYFFHFLKMPDQLVDKNAFVNTLYHKLTVVEIFFLPTKQTEA